LEFKEVSVKAIKLAILIMFLIGFTLAAIPALAHHTLVAIYDPSKPFTMTGTVTMFDWRNPHVWFFMDVKGEDGKLTNWGFELNGVNVLRRAGWSRESLKAGDVITVEGSPARNGGHTANARAITFTNTGQKLLERSNAAATPQ
jgi:Family of unknown function (DUF6152)